MRGAWGAGGCESAGSTSLILCRPEGLLNTTMIDALGMYSRSSVIFFIIILWGWKEGGQNDAAFFVWFITVLFCFFHERPSSKKDTLASIFFKEKEFSALSLCSHLYMGEIQQQMTCQSLCREKHPLLCFSHMLCSTGGQMWNTAMNMRSWPQTPQICVLNRTGQLSALEIRLDFQVWVEWRSDRDSGVKIQRQIIESPNSSWPLGYSHCWDICNQSERNCFKHDGNSTWRGRMIWILYSRKCFE